MTTTRRTVTVHIVRAVLRGVQHRGMDVAPLLQAARIPPLLLADDRARVTPEQFTALVHELYRVTDDEFVGLAPAPTRRGTFAMMCYAAAGCRDLGAATERAIRFYGLFPGSPGLSLHATGGEAVFTVRHRFRGPDDRFLSECVLSVWHRLSGWFIGRRIPLRWVQFGYPPPPYAHEYEAAFGVPVAFRAPRTAAAFPAGLLAAPVVRGEAELEVLLRRAPADLLSRRDYATTVADQVRHVLRQALRAGGGRLPELADVAARLAVSPATLRRRLQREDTSYQRLKDAVRRDAAVHSLADGTETVAALAARLGFSEDTAFHRAFRRWTGTTPGAYRAAGSPGPAGSPGAAGSPGGREPAAGPPAPDPAPASPSAPAPAPLSPPSRTTRR